MWSAQITAMLIEDLKYLPCLWNYNCEMYRNKEAKNEALASLSIRYMIPPWDIDKKIQALKTQFRREHNRLMEMRRGGLTSVRATWFGYKPLSFLLQNLEAPNNCYTPRASDTYLQENEDFSVESPEEGYGDNIKIEAVYNVKGQESVDENREKKQDSDQDETMPEDLAEPMLQDHLQVQSFSKDQVMRTSRLYCRPSPYLTHKRESETERFGDEFTAIGTSVGAKLKRMSETQRNYAEMLMAQVLGMGLLGKLNESTTLCLNKPDESTNEVQNSDAEKNDDNEK